MDIGDTLESIKRNISRVLNTRVGESQSTPELGLFDFNDASASSKDLCCRMQQSIRQCIGRFEPRLTQLQVSVLYDESSPVMLKFLLQGRVNVSHRNDLLKIDLLLDTNRRYRVV
ncbi:type VI secretion system baseplate subunit TssE [Shewanella khirikhana]|uniref:type VI secretion system baseplate subunit TssE n=1 Tax=Shewanella khirikhana TaxID=1965282 RepID=UPI003AB964B7